MECIDFGVRELAPAVPSQCEEEREQAPALHRTVFGESHEIIRRFYRDSRDFGIRLGHLDRWRQVDDLESDGREGRGRDVPGAQLKVYTKLSPGRAFPVKVSELTPLRRMVWTGGMPLGLFTGVRTYALTPVSGGVEFKMTEAFSGLMAPLITRSIPDLQPSFDEFAAALKRRAEQNA